MRRLLLLLAALTLVGLAAENLPIQVISMNRQLISMSGGPCSGKLCRHV